MSNAYRENAMPLEDIESRVKLLEKRDISSEASMVRTVVIGLTLALMFMFGVLYGCSHSGDVARIEVAKVAASKCLDAPPVEEKK